MQLGGCSEEGGIYKCKFISFWYVLVMIFLLQIARVMSKKLTEEEGVTDSMPHFNIPKLLALSLNAVQSVVCQIACPDAEDIVNEVFVIQHISSMLWKEGVYFVVSIIESCPHHGC